MSSALETFSGLASHPPAAPDWARKMIMGSLKAVSVPASAKGLRARGQPEVLIWAEGKEESEVRAVLRAFLTSVACVPYDVPNTAELLQNGQTWQVRRFVRLTLLACEVIVAEIFLQGSDQEPSSWWEGTLVPALRRKYETSDIEAA